ncbi:MAG TPA: PIN domain-containing protein [Xanthomonadaceae bacterium]|nr:PIN domain-containing protein [Xanthomonadaceae bacterium]
MRVIADANVLLPLLTEGHAHRAPAAAWWEDCEDDSVGLCLPVRMALLRLLTNARVMGSSILHPEQAWDVLGVLIDDARIVIVDHAPKSHAQHWRANIEGREPSPDLWTDAWLAALAQASDCEMITFDRGFRAFADLKLHLLSPARTSHNRP